MGGQPSSLSIKTGHYLPASEMPFPGSLSARQRGQLSARQWYAISRATNCPLVKRHFHGRYLPASVTTISRAIIWPPAKRHFQGHYLPASETPFPRPLSARQCNAISRTTIFPPAKRHFEGHYLRSSETPLERDFMLTVKCLLFCFYG